MTEQELLNELNDLKKHKADNQAKLLEAKKIINVVEDNLVSIKINIERLEQKLEDVRNTSNFQVLEDDIRNSEIAHFSQVQSAMMQIVDRQDGVRNQKIRTKTVEDFKRKVRSMAAKSGD